jgi:hypothetical protein
LAGNISKTGIFTAENRLPNINPHQAQSGPDALYAFAGFVNGCL